MCSCILQLFNNNIWKFYCNCRISPRSQKGEPFLSFWCSMMRLKVKYIYILIPCWFLTKLLESLAVWCTYNCWVISWSALEQQLNRWHCGRPVLTKQCFKIISSILFLEHLPSLMSDTRFQELTVIIPEEAGFDPWVNCKAKVEKCIFARCKGSWYWLLYKQSHL